MIYEAILEQAQRHWQDGMQPVAVRLNEATLNKLKEELTPTQRLRFGKTTYERITVLETDFGPMRMMYDKHMPEDAVIVLVRYNSLIQDMTRVYYDGEYLEAE